MILNSINYYSKEVRQLSAAEKKYYFQLASTGNEYARNRLKEHYTLFVIHLIKKKLKINSVPGLDIDDLISIGIIGMFKALDTFKLEKGADFVSYAKTCIKNEILTELRNNKKYYAISLDKPAYVNDDSLTLLDTLCDDFNIEEEYIKYELYGEVRRALSILTAKEYQIIDMHYGFGCTMLSQKEIGATIHRCQTTVSRIETPALTKIKDYLLEIENSLDYHSKSEVVNEEAYEQKEI